MRNNLRFWLSITLWFNMLYLESSETSRREYLDLVRRYPRIVEPRGSADEGEIEIVLDEKKMACIETAARRDVGIIARDEYWMWINDACLFPSGHHGIYGRILWTKTLESHPTGVVILPILPDGRIVLIRIYRHATRSWEIELPRGGINRGENAESAARREAKEEAGVILGDLSLLAEMTPDSGVTGTIVPIFQGKVIDGRAPEREDTEAIAGTLCLSPEEARRALQRGYYQQRIHGAERRTPFRDPFLAFALLLYEVDR